MAKFRITGQKKLNGEMSVGGAKNAALKILPAAILADAVCRISNVPDILDIKKTFFILESIGAKIDFLDNVATVDPTNINSHHPNEKAVKKLRGSIVLIGALLSKYGKAVFSQPGGCLIGSRPIDDHLDLFRQLGVEIDQKTTDHGTVYYLNGKPKAGKIVLNKMSVTATENAILSTVLSEGKSEIHLAAAEPEIADLANFLNQMGAKITGAGTHVVTVHGVDSLTHTDYEIMPDRIEAGTYMIAAVITNSVMTIGPVIADDMAIFLKKLNAAGANFEIIKKDGREFIQTSEHGELVAESIDTRPYPGFSTDLQSPYAALMTQARGSSDIFETMFEGRFAYTEEIVKMEGDVEIRNPHELVVTGPTPLVGTEISAADIRGGVALVISALIADGETIINDIEYIDRGYEKIDEKLRAVGAEIERIAD